MIVVCWISQIGEFLVWNAVWVIAYDRVMAQVKVQLRRRSGVPNDQLGGGFVCT